MSIKALQEYTRFSKYAKYIPNLKRRETWNEQISRVMDMHREFFKDKIDILQEDLEFVENMLHQKRILGSQRALQFGGLPIIAKNARMYNCCASYIDRPRLFQEAMYVLLCGCGAGFSVQTHHINQLPTITAPTNQATYTIPDSIEGWSDAIGILLSGYFTSKQPFPEYAQCNVNFDYSQIRPEGSPISHGGKAPGPKGLRNSIEKIRELLDRTIDGKSSARLRPIDAYDIVMHISDSVLSGGIRRSACICLFSPDDEEMIKSKTGNWQITNPQRGRANNSALLSRENTTRERFAEIMTSVKEFGEPGFFWTDDKDIIFNPCLIGDTWITTIDGPQQIKNIIGQKTKLLINGKFVSTTDKGFWQTGVQPIVRIELENGNIIKATRNHKFLVNNKWIAVEELNYDDEISLSENNEDINWLGTGGTTGEGWLIGNLIGDGTISDNACRWSYWGSDKHIMHNICKSLLEQCSPEAEINKKYEFTNNPSTYNNHVNIYSLRFKETLAKYNIINTDTKRITPAIECGSSDFCRGIIGGIFDADGSVWGGHKQGLYASIAQTNIENLRSIQRMLNRFGIVSNIILSQPAGRKLLPDGKGGEKYYECQDQFELRVCGRYMVEKFFHNIHILSGEKYTKFQNLINQYTKKAYKSTKLYTSTIKSMVYSSAEEAVPVYDCTIPDGHCFDANGIISHNCGEISLYPQTEAGESGWEFCNLCEINMKKVKTEEEFYDSCRAVAILGTLQAAYTSFPYLGEITEKIVKREALLGISMTGMMDSPDIAFNASIQRKGAKIITQINEDIAKKIEINLAARLTCVKPAGNSSCVLGTSSGIHAHHAKRYFRHVQANKVEPALKFFRQFNPKAVEESVWSANNTDVVIKFLCEVPPGSITKNQMSALELLDHVKLTQQNWIAYGTRPERCSHPRLQHNVSNTINVKQDEWHEVEKYIYRNRHWFAGISLLPVSGDKDYAQAPFTAVHTPSEIVQMYGDGSIFASGLIVDGLRCFNNDLWSACDILLGIGDKPLNFFFDDIDLNKGDLVLVTAREEHPLFLEKKDWLRRAIQFANRYFDSDIRKMTYCLKDVRNWKVWCDLKREYKDVPWDDFTEDTDNTKIIQTVACAGGKCELL